MILTVRFNFNRLLIPLMIFALVFSIVFLRYVKKPSNRPTTLITVEKNQSFGQTIMALEKNQVLQDKIALKVLVKLTGADKKIRSGTFEFYQPSTPFEIIHALTKGKMVLQEVVIPEGFTMKEIAATLEEKGITNAQAFLAACKDPNTLQEFDVQAEHCEGYLFPETYQFVKNMDATLVVQTMIDHLFQKITPEHEYKAKALNLNVHEWITLASIIEKEAANPTEYRRIASVFHNRLNQKMRLESDPTIIYGIPNYDGNIRKKHIRMPHAYNTYVIKGLPPGPIASPGWGALEATLDPETTEYLFFVADHNRKHVFSKTYAEHQKNVYKYQVKKR